MGLAHYAIFFASGSKGNEVRADGSGGHLQRGYYFHDHKRVCHGPYANKRQAIRARDHQVISPTSPREDMTDHERELLRDHLNYTNQVLGIHQLRAERRTFVKFTSSEAEERNIRESAEAVAKVFPEAARIGRIEFKSAGATRKR